MAWKASVAWIHAWSLEWSAKQFTQMRNISFSILDTAARYIDGSSRAKLVLTVILMWCLSQHLLEKTGIRFARERVLQLMSSRYICATSPGGHVAQCPKMTYLSWADVTGILQKTILEWQGGYLAERVLKKGSRGKFEKPTRGNFQKPTRGNFDKHSRGNPDKKH